MNILLVSGDLMLMAAAEGIVRSHGGTLTSTSAQDAATRCCELQPRVVALDLRTDQLHVTELVTALRASAREPVFILAFGPHVQEASLQAAAAAGCDEVATRGQFELRLRAAVERLGKSAR